MAGVASQESLLFPTRVPAEVKVLGKAAPAMDKAFFRRLLKLSLGYLEGSGRGEGTVRQLCEMAGAVAPAGKDAVVSATPSLETARAVCVQYSGAVTLLRAVLRLTSTASRQDTLRADLLTLGLSEEQATDVCRIAFGAARPDIERRVQLATPALPTLLHLHWRVEVTISTSWVSRVLEPVVVVRLDTSDGTSHTFQVPIAKFHQLRYTVASLFHQMAALQSSPVCKKLP